MMEFIVDKWESDGIKVRLFWIDLLWIDYNLWLERSIFYRIFHLEFFSKPLTIFSIWTFFLLLSLPYFSIWKLSPNLSMRRVYRILEILPFPLEPKDRHGPGSLSASFPFSVKPTVTTAIATKPISDEMIVSNEMIINFTLQK